MIIELFGPPGAGKTTLAHTLTARLRECGTLTELKLSHRPTEPPSALGSCRRPASSKKRYQNAVMQRLNRPLRETLAIARHPLINSRDIRIAVHLMRLLPPPSIFESIKQVQYLLRLS